MTDDFIIRELKNKEAQLINELNKVQLALNAFIDKNLGFGNTNYHSLLAEDTIPKSYNSNLTYGSKILFILSNETETNAC